MMQNRVNMDGIGGQSRETENGWHRSSPIWKGSLYGRRQGEPVFITKLEGYRSSSASDTLAADWPPEMQIVQLKSLDDMNTQQYVGEADFLVFRAMNPHGYLGQLKEQRLCAVIQLPSQTLLLSVSDKICRLNGMLFPRGMEKQEQLKYVRVWEGSLYGLKQGEPVLITKLEGYRSSSASETLAADWPPEMQIVRLISQDHMNNKKYVGEADFLVFRARDPHGFLGVVQEKKLCAVIQLPSQTLLLSVSDKACRLIGMLFPGDMVVFKPQLSSQQQQQMQQQHQQMQSQHTTSAQSNYISVWEGSLLGLRQGQPVFITKLEAYRNSSSSETYAIKYKILSTRGYSGTIALLHCGVLTVHYFPLSAIDNTDFI